MYIFYLFQDREKDLLYREAKIVKSKKYFLNNLMQGIH